MPLRYLIDEQMPVALSRAIQRHNAAGVHSIDAVRVGDPPDLPRGTADPDILIWAEREGRILVSLDRNTLPGHLADHLQAGHHSPGIWLVRNRVTVGQILGYLTRAAHATGQTYFQDAIWYIP